MRNVQVQVIPAKKPKMSSKNFTPTGKRKVAAYARVSTDSEEQFLSFTGGLLYKLHKQQGGLGIGFYIY